VVVTECFDSCNPGMWFAWEKFCSPELLLELHHKAYHTLHKVVSMERNLHPLRRISKKMQDCCCRIILGNVLKSVVEAWIETPPTGLFSRIFFEHEEYSICWSMGEAQLHTQYLPSRVENHWFFFYKLFSLNLIKRKTSEFTSCIKQHSVLCILLLFLLIIFYECN
jgi:hypothetical protein